MSPTVVSLNALPPQVIPPLATGATGIGSSAIINQNQATQQQMALIGSGVSKRRTRRRQSQRRSIGRSKRRCKGKGKRRTRRSITSKRQRTRRNKGRQTRRYWTSRGGTPVALVPPVSPGAVNAAATANMYKQLTEVANTQAIQSRFDVAKTPQDTAALQAQQQALYKS